MSCTTFFQPYLNWLNQTPANNMQNVVAFLMSSGRSESNQFVLYGSGLLTLDQVVPGPLLMTGQARVYFSDRQSNTGGITQPFDANQSEIEIIRIDPQGLNLERLSLLNSTTIGSYGNFQCNSNGLLVCTSLGTKEMLILSFRMTTAPPAPM